MKIVSLTLAAFALTAAGTPGPAASVPMTAEDGRYTMAVSVGGEPLRFVVDSANDVTFIAAEVLPQLGLAPTKDAQGNDVVAVANYENPLFHRGSDTLAVVSRGSQSAADGDAGMDLFADRRIVLDFAAGTFAAEASGPTPAGLTAVPVTLFSKTFVIADVTIDGIKAKALIDTGARRTIANLLLKDALGLKDGDARLSEDHPTPNPAAPPAAKATMDGIDIGAVHIAKPVVSFTALGFFKAVGLGEVPALLIGSDLLRKFHIVAIDYPRAELQLQQ